jgi:hypothetical protein
MVRCGLPANVDGATRLREQMTMTEQRPAPGSDTAPDEVVRDAERRPATRDPGTDRAGDDKESNPMLREGADAPDAADIEDPDEQL